MYKHCIYVTLYNDFYCSHILYFHVPILYFIYCHACMLGASELLEYWRHTNVRFYYYYLLLN